MREPISNDTIGKSFSKFLNNIICNGDLSTFYSYQNYSSDILSIWECNKTNRKFAFYANTGLREISNSLFYRKIFELEKTKPVI